ncbi:MAG: endopeptidase La [Burkholderiales bacterium]|nr:endopeptidase La [Burkholderiales bacterium]
MTAEAETTDPQRSAALPSDALIILPVRNMVLFPGLIAPLALGRPETIAGAQEAARLQRTVGILLQRSPEIEAPAAADLHDVGTAAGILRYVTTPDGTHNLIVQGEQRFRVHEYLEGYPFRVARVEMLAEAPELDRDLEARMLQVKQRVGELVELLPRAPEGLAAAVDQVTSPAALADFVAGLLDIKTAEKQELLETFDVRTRLDRVLAFMAARIDVLRLSREIGEQTQGRLEGRQREALLREQLKTIQSELGEGEGTGAEIEQLRGEIEKAGMPDEVAKHARKELARLAQMSEQSPEYSMVRTYLDRLVELPWTLPAEAPISLDDARRVLDEDHFGLVKIKRRILEYLAVRKLNPEGKTPILCFVGPPGVGKTSLGQSIARALGRKFQRLSLGGVYDESEIRGHRRTYIGAMPGNIIQAIRKAGSRNCVLMLDEIDKLGTSLHGDPAAALLEVLDPEQNAAFRDTYLGVAFDLSRVVFIATANVLDRIPGPLRDRMEVIDLPGYTEQEKLEIARRYLVPRQAVATGVGTDQCVVTDAALRTVIADYTRESGVRNLEREIGNLFRHAAMRIAEGGQGQVVVGSDEVVQILGPQRFDNEVMMRTSVAGVATGLAWTPVGGDILFIETSRTPGSGKLILTGHLGDVMKESAQAALTLVKARSASLGIDPAIFEKSDIHMHIPAGAIPKDGPSAGVAMFTSLASLVLDRPVRHDVAMTGEISLRGLVLPVGGIKEKVLAALRAGITTVLLPARNRRDVEEIPADAREQLSFHYVESVDDALQQAIDPTAPTAPAASAATRDAVSRG